MRYADSSGNLAIKALSTVQANRTRFVPWCIADGSAHTKLKAEFVDIDCIGGGNWESVRTEIAEAIAYRTPGFSGWQQERWFTHCSDGAECLGAMGKQELLRAGADAVKVIRDESGYASDEWERYFDGLNAEHGPATAYLFKCRHCGTIGGYSDCR